MISDLPHSAIDVAFVNNRPALIAQYNEKPMSSVQYDIKKYRGALRAELPVAEAIVDEIALMAENWDGYGAIQIANETARNVKAALSKLYNLVPIPDITPNPNGTISLEWESAEGFAHLEIGRTLYSFYIKPRSGLPVLADGNADQIGSDIGSWLADMLFPLNSAAETITSIILTNNVLRSAY